MGNSKKLGQAYGVDVGNLYIYLRDRGEDRGWRWDSS